MKQKRLPVERRIEIFTDQHERIIAYLRKYQSDTVMLMCSGGGPLSGVSNFFHFLDIYHQGLPINVLRFDFRGTGESDGDNAIDIPARMYDLQLMIDYCHRHWKKIVLYAPSMGALVSILTLPHTKHVTWLALLSPLVNLDEVGFPVKAQFAFYRLLHPHKYAQQMSFVEKNMNISRITMPTIIAYGTNDSWVHPKQSIDLHNSLTVPKLLVAFEGADHTLQTKNDNDEQTRFFVSQLKKLMAG